MSDSWSPGGRRRRGIEARRWPCWRQKLLGPRPDWLAVSWGPCACAVGPWDN